MLSFSFKRPLYRGRENQEGSTGITADAISPSTVKSSTTATIQSDPISKTAFFSGSLGIFSIGILYGIRRAMKEEKDPFHMKNNVQGIHLGAKAFLLGTLLCIGTAAGLGAIFIYKSGITDAKQFGDKSREFVTSLGIFPQVDIYSDDLRKETEELEKDIETFISSISTVVGFGPDATDDKNEEGKK